DSLAVARRFVAAASLAAKEYAIGVTPRGGQVTNPEEVSEAKQFLDQARLDVGSLPRAVRATADSDLAALRAMLDRAAAPDSVAARAGLLAQRIARVVGGALESFPARPPSLVRSEEHTSELQSPYDIVCRLLLEKKTWPNAYSLPIAVRYTQDSFSCSGWLWPVHAND